MNRIELEEGKNEWIDVSNVILWGGGRNCRLYLENIRKLCDVEAIVDNDINKKGTLICDIPVFFPEQINLNNKKIIVTTSYEEVSKQLIDMGYVENRGLKNKLCKCNFPKINNDFVNNT